MQVVWEAKGELWFQQICVAQRIGSSRIRRKQAFDSRTKQGGEIMPGVSRFSILTGVPRFRQSPSVIRCRELAFVREAGRSNGATEATEASEASDTTLDGGHHGLFVS